MSKRERWLEVRKHWLCRTCLKRHPRRCSVDKKCGVDGCMSEKEEVTDPAKTVAKVSVNYHQVTRSVLYRVIPVFVYGPTRRIKTLAFIDEGSSITLAENSLAEEIGLDGPRSDLCLRWTGDVVRTELNSRLVSFEFSGIAKFSKRYTLRDVNTVQCLVLPQQTLSSEMLEMCCHIKGLPIATYAENRPTIIIGHDQYQLVPPLKTRAVVDTEPIAVRTPLGWTICGACQLPAGEHHAFYHRCECRTEADSKTRARVEEFFSLENFGILPGRKLVSKDDSRAVDVITLTSRCVGGRYQVGLLWNHDIIRMPNSPDMALRRMLHFKAKLKKSPDLQRVVNYKMKDYLANCYAQKIDVDKLEHCPKTLYLSPYVDENGLLRVVDNAQHVSVKMKRPIILPTDHIVTYRLVERLRVLCRKIIHGCKTCQIMRAKPRPPIMGLLPKERMEAYVRTFHNVGVDLSGPLTVIVRRRSEKRWYVLSDFAIHEPTSHNWRFSQWVIDRFLGAVLARVFASTEEGIKMVHTIRADCNRGCSGDRR